MNIAQHVELGRRRFGARAALIAGSSTVSYAELDTLAGRFAGGLRGLGIARGDRVALFLPNSVAFVVCYLGALKLGAIAVSLNTNLQSGDVAYMLADSGAAALVTTQLLRAQVPDAGLPLLRHIVIAEGRPGDDTPLDAMLAEGAPYVEALDLARDDPAAIVYTSGTTGAAKGATLSHGNVVSNMRAKQRYLGIRPDDRLLLFTPLYHCFGQNAILNSGLASGATIVLHRQFDPESVLRSVQDDRVTMFFGVPPTFVMLLERASIEALRSVRYYFSAAARLPEEIEARWHVKFGIVINQGYGLTETSPFASYNHLVHYRPGSVGTAIDDVEIKIVDPVTRRDVLPGEAGEIVVRGPNVMLGYWNRPADTAAAIRDGWFHTGDIGSIDADGYVFLQDRLKDMVNLGGLKVYPAEVENVLFQHPAVADAAVYGVPDALLGERLVACVVARAGNRAGAEQLLAFCRARLAGFKVPTSVVWADSIPKNPTGKVLKRVLREQYALAAAGATPATQQTSGETPSFAASQHWLREWLVANLQLDAATLSLGRSLFDYGLHSVLAVKMALDLGDWLGRSVDATIAWRYPTGEALALHLAGPASATNQPAAAAPKPAEPSVDLAAFSDGELARLLAEEIELARRAKQGAGRT